MTDRYESDGAVAGYISDVLAGYAPQFCQLLSFRYCAVPIVYVWCSYGFQVLLDVHGHGEAHGT